MNRLEMHVWNDGMLDKSTWKCLWWVLPAVAVAVAVAVAAAGGVVVLLPQFPPIPLPLLPRSFAFGY